MTYILMDMTLSIAFTAPLGSPAAQGCEVQSRSVARGEWAG